MGREKEIEMQTDSKRETDRGQERHRVRERYRDRERQSREKFVVQPSPLKHARKSAIPLETM